MTPQPKNSSSTNRAISRSLAQTLDDGTWRSYEGPKTEQLKKWISESHNAEHVRLCSSGTFAVELALRGFKLKADDEVILSSYDYPGNFRSIEDCGAKIVLCEPAANKGWVLTTDVLNAVATPQCRGLVVSHLHGQLAPMKSIMNWASERGIWVVEDACQVHGATVDGKPAGSWGHMGVFSFGGSKLVSAGRGGVVITNDSLFAQRMGVYCDRGNNAFPFSEVQAALVLPQYEGLANDHKARLGAAERILHRASSCPWLQIPEPYCSPDREGNSPAFYKLGLLIKGLEHASSDVAQAEISNGLRDRMLRAMLEKGLEVGPGFRGFASRSPKRYRAIGPLHQCEDLAARTILLHHSMLVDPESGEDNSGRVIEFLNHLTPESLS
ncbi:DegT/DnrJ/EryC1/StrS family aminotransferase [Pirellulaceae bacterium SH449]